MSISFIITTYNIQPYIEECLQSVAEVALDGDEIIVVDDGSDDGTVEAIRDFAEQSGFGPHVDFRPIFLGTNTIGGVGIGANIGLEEATKETVFFVDGDDWIEANGFRRARAYWALHPTDILFTNYTEYDQKAGQTKFPADAQRWNHANGGLSLEESRALGLDMIAVPWRKFYRRQFLNRANLRFPEGDFFFEDNPFHWAVCLAAQSIGFVNEITCNHRVNRPGQTMASTGVELTAFFTHFNTIMAQLPKDDGANRAAACRWLLNNMTWHMGRLADNAHYRYAQAASRALQVIPDHIWADVEAQNDGKNIWPIAVRLRRGDVDGQVLQWQNLSLERKLSGLDQRMQSLEALTKQTLTRVRSMQAVETYTSLQKLFEET